nr:cytochrome c oxidase assembly protein COX18, mitochondrial-like [Procambarus clarkii]XP_045600431.1 cytochrome c oxidase assembly protein COX18, mitochondrial-like [Procambarus clarkii]
MPLKIGCFGLPKKWLQESSCSYINVLCKRRLHFEIRPVIQCRLKYPGAAVKSSIHSYQGSAHRKLILISPFYSCATRIHFLEEDVLPRCNPSLTQICRYHIFSGNRNSCYRVKQNCFPETSLHHPQINVVIKRHLSLAWLDSLAITQASWFQALSQSRLVEGLMTGLQGIHDQLHLPWWAAIIVSTILMRGILTLPVTVYQNYIIAKLDNLKPEMNELVKELKKETAYAIKKFGWSEREARLMFNLSARKIWKNLIIRDNCHPFKTSILLWVQIPLWIAMSMSFRNMASMLPHRDAAAQVLFLELSTGGFGWIPNLTEVDSSLILPIAMGIINLIIIEVNVLNRFGEASKTQRIATHVFRAVSVAIIPIAATVPSCLAMYWVTSSACGLAQTLALMHPRLRHLCGIPRSSSQRENPYQHLWLQLQKRMEKKKE